MRSAFGILNRRPWLGCSVVSLTLVSACIAWLQLPAAPIAPSPARDRQVTLRVRGLIESEHLSRHALDDEISMRAIKSFLEGFDPRKMYFLQSDIDEFMKKDRSLDDDVRQAKLGFARDVFDRYMQRLNERVTLVEELLAEQHDFKVDEEIITDPEALIYPSDAAEARERWRKLIKLNLLTFKADGEEEAEARRKIGRRYQSLKKRWGQTDSDELLERFLTAVTSSYDPHTTYMSPTTLENFRILMRLNLEGIGAALQISDEGYTVVSKVIPGGAADKDGRLKPDDRIVSVGQGDTGEMVDVVDMKLNDVVQLIRGKAGTIVRLGTQSGGAGETSVYDITRAKIELADSAAKSRVIQRGQKPDGEAYNFGIIDLPSFYMDMEAARDEQNEFRSTTRDVRRILSDFRSKNVDAVVLDLRQNGGGSLTEAITLTGLFIDQGPVVQVKDWANRKQSFNDLEPGMAWDGPFVVLTSKFSASASEILAGAIQDYHRGLIIGDESTHGKGTVQSLLDIGSLMFRIPNPPNLGALKITQQQFYRPNGDSTQKRGVLPDIVLPSLTNEIGMGEAELDYAVDFDRIETAKFNSYNMVAANSLQRLRTHSEKRITESEEYKKELARIERYQRLKDEKSISLNEEKYLARRDTERDAEEEQEKQLEEQQGAVEREIFEDNFQNNEVIDITLDYLKELANNKVARAR
ncbi:MAG: tail-specific protease [Planctomycetaceae bacterium]|nr:tail-specific protease [Planctomycetaceae bacterium]